MVKLPGQAWEFGGLWPVPLGPGLGYGDLMGAQRSSLRNVASGGGGGEVLTGTGPRAGTSLSLQSRLYVLFCAYFANKCLINACLYLDSA